VERSSLAQSGSNDTTSPDQRSAAPGRQIMRQRYGSKRDSVHMVRKGLGLDDAVAVEQVESYA